MSDVLLYAALKENSRLLDEYIDYKIDSKKMNVEDYPDLDFYKVPQPEGWPVRYCPESYWGNGVNCKGSTKFNKNVGYMWGVPNSRDHKPWMVKAWEHTLKPKVQEMIDSVGGGNTGFTVCAPPNCWNCGANCSWTVPAGTTKMVVEMWGPTHSNSSTCCCSWHPFGHSGAYHILKADLTPGETVCFVAGCGSCCNYNQTVSSQATGGFTNMYIANASACLNVHVGGGDTNIWLNYSKAIAPRSGYNLTHTPTDPYGRTMITSWCSAASWSLCRAGSAGCDVVDEMWLPHHFQPGNGYGSWYYCISTSKEDRNVECYGLNAMNPEVMFHDPRTCSGWSAWSRAGFVFKFEEATCMHAEAVTGRYAFDYTGANQYVSGCCHHATNRVGTPNGDSTVENECRGFMAIPGRSPFAGSVSGGAGACPGDKGGRGQICVYYC